MRRAKGFFAVVILAGFLGILVAGCATTAYVIKEPPPLKEEVAIGPKPHPDAVWIGGHWKWNSHAHDYVWVSGHWARPPKGKMWVPGHWDRTPRGWRWVDGHWRR